MNQPRYGLSRVFREAYDDLSLYESGLLFHDFELAAEKDGCTHDEYANRIGGPNNLRSYVDCLVAGAERKKRESARPRGAFPVALASGGHAIVRVYADYEHILVTEPARDHEGAALARALQIASYTLTHSATGLAVYIGLEDLGTAKRVARLLAGREEFRAVSMDDLRRKRSGEYVWRDKAKGRALAEVVRKTIDACLIDSLNHTSAEG